MLTQTVFTHDPDDLEKIGLLEEVLLDPNPGVLYSFSTSGALGDLIPEWQRLNGPRNVQNSAHHFRLDDHTLKVIERTKRSTYYLELTDYQQFIAVLAALLHDIDKNTGPERLRGKIPVDKLHPLKSAQMTRKILERMKFPPKTIQRTYTLVHHHQAFGRLFVLFPEGGADREWLRRIAVKIRSIGVLECLLALSEGDIRAVQREDAYFTPRVAESLWDYAENVRRAIMDARSKIPLLPQNLALSLETRTLNLAKSACFVLPAQSWDELVTCLEQIRWAGAMMMPYWHKLTPLAENHTPCAALIRFLPENIAYWGPKPHPLQLDPPYTVNMDLFYALFQGEPLNPAIFPSEQQEILRLCQAQQPGINALLQAVSERVGYENWTYSYRAFDEGWFEPSDFPLPVDPLLLACQSQYLETYPGDETMGVATRPILMGFYRGEGVEVPALPSPWDKVTVFQAA